MPLVPSVMQFQINNVISQSGRAVQHQRHTGAVYNAAITYQNPTVDTITINESISASWIPSNSKMAINYFGVLNPDDTTVLVSSSVDLAKEDLLVLNYNTPTEIVYKVTATATLEYQGTKIGTMAVLLKLPGRRVT